MSVFLQFTIQLALCSDVCEKWNVKVDNMIPDIQNLPQIVVEKRTTVVDKVRRAITQEDEVMISTCRFQISLRAHAWISLTLSHSFLWKRRYKVFAMYT